MINFTSLLPILWENGKTKKIKALLQQTVGYSMYNGWNNRGTYGYHSYNMNDVKIPGQRDPSKRLAEFRKHIDFKDKVVIDFGCNVGAMLHHLTEIKQGLGFDYDSRCIKAAKEITVALGQNNLLFKTHDFDKESYQSLKKKINLKPDIIFILSLGSWIKSWKKLYALALASADVIVLEVNNMEEGQSQIEYFTKAGHNLHEIIPTSTDDSTGNGRRKTFIITKKTKA